LLKETTNTFGYGP